LVPLNEIIRTPDNETLMPDSEIEIVVDDPTAPEANSPAVTNIRIVDIAVSLLLIVLAATLGYDNWRTGIAWDSTGPQAGYFPFYLSVILAGASLYGLVAAFKSREETSETFVTRAQLRRGVRADLAVLSRNAISRALCREFSAYCSLHAMGRAHRAVEIAAHRLCVHRRDVPDLRYRL
jgi:hypothetical protein